MATLTPEFARELQAKSVVARQLAKEEAKFAAAAALLETRQNPQVVRLAKQLARVEELLDDTNDGKELAALTAAHDRIFKAWCVLTDTKQPGTSRGSKRHRPVEVQPLDIQAPAPAPAPDPRPLGWEYDG